MFKEPIALSPGEGRTYGVVGHKYRLLVTGDQTGGDYAVIEGTVPPGDGPPPHRHLEEDELLYVAEGTLTIVLEGRETEASPGVFVLVPRGTVHTLFNRGPRTARVLVIVRPARLDRFFEAVGVPMDDPTAEPPPPTAAHLRDVIQAAPGYGMEILPGPGPSSAPDRRQEKHS